jgi:hypothetical protein
VQSHVASLTKPLLQAVHCTSKKVQFKGLTKKSVQLTAAEQMALESHWPGQINSNWTNPDSLMRRPFAVSGELAVSSPEAAQNRLKGLLTAVTLPAAERKTLMQEQREEEELRGEESNESDSQAEVDAVEKMPAKKQRKMLKCGVNSQI